MKAGIGNHIGVNGGTSSGGGLPGLFLKGDFKEGDPEIDVRDILDLRKDDLHSMVVAQLRALQGYKGLNGISKETDDHHSYSCKEIWIGYTPIGKSLAERKLYI